MSELDENPTEVIYDRAARPVFRDLAEMFIEPGTARDWDLLHHLHYKSEGRLVGPRYWRVDLRGETIGVAIANTPRALMKERHIAFSMIKPKGPSSDDKISNTARYHSINRNMLAMTRLVLDTNYRGIGVAYRCMNLASRMSGARFIESQAAMAKYNMFVDRSGFTAVKPQRSVKFEVGLRFMKSHFESNPADTHGLIQEINAMKPAARAATIRDVIYFYQQHSTLERTGNARLRPSRAENMDVGELIRQLQQMILSSPLYSFYENPDFGRKLPDRLPLLAFHRQKTNEPLVL